MHLPFQTPLDLSHPPVSELNGKQRTAGKGGGEPGAGSADDKNSIVGMEAELHRRQADLIETRNQLEAFRLQITDPQSLQEYVINRDRLLTAVDCYERALSKYERQVRRVSYLYVKLGRDQQPTAALDSGEHDASHTKSSLAKLEEEKEALLKEQIRLIDRVEDAQQQAFKADETVRSLDEQLALSRQAQDTLQKQLRQQAKISAELSMERSILRKEVAEMQSKFATILSMQSSTNSPTGSHSATERDEQISLLIAHNCSLKEELSEKTEAIAKLSLERDLLMRGGEDMKSPLSSPVVSGLGTFTEDSQQIVERLNAQLWEKQQEVSTLRERLLDGGDGQLLQELQGKVEVLSKDRDAALAKVNALQAKLLDYQDASQLDAKHRAQLEAVRRNLEENWKKFNADLAERDDRILELQQRILFLSRAGGSADAKHEPAPSGPALSLPATALLKDQIERLSQKVSELELNYAELYRAKESQEKYLTGKIAKLRRRLYMQANTIIEEENQDWEHENDGQEGDEDQSIKDAHRPDPSSAMLEQLVEENIRIKKEKDTELYALQLRLNRLSEERERLKAQLEEHQSSLVSKAQLKALNTEIESLAKERSLLKDAIHGDSTKIRELTAELQKATQKIRTIEDLLDCRSEELAKLESNHKEQQRTIEAQEQTIEYLKREFSSKSRLAKTEKSMIKRALKDAEMQLERRKEEEERLVERLTKERDSLAQALERAGKDSSGSENYKPAGYAEQADVVRELQGRIFALNQSLIEKQRCLEALENQLAAKGVRDPRANGDALHLDGLWGGTDALAQEKLQLELQLADLRQYARDLEIQAKVETDRSAALESQLRSVEGELEGKKALIEELSEGKEALELRLEEIDSLTVQAGSTKAEHVLGTKAAAAEKQMLQAEILQKDREIARLVGVTAEAEGVREELVQEKGRAQELEKLCQNRNDMIDLAEKEMNKLQAQLSYMDEIDQQRKALLGKYQMLKEELRGAEERLLSQEAQIKELKHASQEETSAPSASLQIDQRIQEMERERERMLEDQRNLERINANLEHEKTLLEGELENAKSAYRLYKNSPSVQDHRELFKRAGRIIAELGKREEEEGWSLLRPLKSVATFAKIYKPAEVDVKSLQEEYEKVMTSLDGLPYPQNNKTAPEQDFVMDELFVGGSDGAYGDEGAKERADADADAHTDSDTLSSLPKVPPNQAGV